jgi:predicted transcriptional regulator of viral defense system
VLGQDQASAEVIICCIAPFCYLSHLSATEYHGLTDRLPKLLDTVYGVVEAFYRSLPWGQE